MTDIHRSQKISFEIKHGSQPALPLIYRPLTNWQYSNISFLNRNSESAVNQELVLLTWNSMSLEAVRVCVTASLPKIFYVMYGSN